MSTATTQISQWLRAHFTPGSWYWRLAIHLICMAPALGLYLAYTRGDLAPDPAKELVLESGEIAIRWLLLCLSISPLRRAFNLPALILWRRPLGLWAAAWAFAHASLFAVLYIELSPAEFILEVQEHPYIVVGMLAVVLMIPLAATSNRFAMRALKHNWATLHRLVYLAALLALIHLIWQIRDSFADAFFFSTWLGILFAERLWRHFQGKAKQQPAKS